jgi:hypothetical protein
MDAKNRLCIAIIVNKLLPKIILVVVVGDKSLNISVKPKKIKRNIIMAMKIIFIN